MVDRIVEAAAVLPADLIVLGTEGRNGWLDVLRDSVTERIVSPRTMPGAGGAGAFHSGVGP